MILCGDLSAPIYNSVLKDFMCGGAFNIEKVLVGAFSEHIEYQINSMSKLLDSAGHRAELGHYVGGGWRGEEFFIELYKHEQGHWLAIVCHTIIK